MYEILTRHIPVLKKGEYGEWVFDTKNGGTLEHPFRLPFVIYSESVNSLHEDIYRFVDAHPQHRRYSEILEKNGLEWGMNSMTGADVSQKDGECVVALLLGADRAERFSEGTLFKLLENGSILRWLIRLKEIDEKE